MEYPEEDLKQSRDDADRYRSTGGRGGDQRKGDGEGRYSRRETDRDRFKQGEGSGRERDERVSRGRGDPDSRHEQYEQRGRDEGRSRQNGDRSRDDRRDRGDHDRQRGEGDSPGGRRRSRSRQGRRGEWADREDRKRREEAPDPAKEVIRQRHAHHGLGTDELVPDAREPERSPSSASPLPSDSDVSAM